MDSIRRSRNMTQKQFAEALEISQSAVSKYLSGRMPPADVMLKIARLAHTSVEWILCGVSAEENRIIKEETSGYKTTADFLKDYNALPAPVRAGLNIIINYLGNQRK